MALVSLWRYSVRVFPVAIRSETPDDASGAASGGRQGLLFVLHSIPAYLISWFWTPWLAGRVYDWVLPLVRANATESRMQFMFLHLFALTFLPGVLAGLINAKYRHRVAAYVWILPAIVLIYKLLTFSTSVFEDHWSLAFHYYFAGNFYVPEFHSYRDLFGMMTPGSDMLRGMAQLSVTGAFYAAVGYSVAAFAGPLFRDKFEARRTGQFVAET